ncbi:hypothetical protein MRX96_025445 [Rhipicephalus microplus]
MFRQGSLSSQPDLLAVTHGGRPHHKPGPTRFPGVGPMFWAPALPSSMLRELLCHGTCILACFLRYEEKAPSVLQTLCKYSTTVLSPLSPLAGNKLGSEPKR